ncbi:MAG: hypothetical protein LBE82_11915 [Chitinophagaceae bacterium]|nr:hypothetical protein [Chitinophagaceae bacterium]
MKRVIVFALLFSTIAFASCSKKSGPAPGQESTAFDIPFSLQGAAGATTTMPSNPTTVSLSNIISSANKDKVNNIFSSTLSLTSSLSFTGVTGTGATLSNISFATSDKGVNSGILVDAFGKSLVISNDTTLTSTTQSYFNFFKQVGDYLAKNKNINLTFTYTLGNAAISSGTANLHIATTFSWQ